MAKTLEWQTYQEQLEKLASLEYNYDDKIYHANKDKQGWNVDRYQASLANEAPGEPAPEGPFEAAKKAIQLYQFPDPRLIRAIFNPDATLPGRNMLMLAKFAGFHFTFGVRVTAVIDEVRYNTSNQPLKVWGYSYRTLKGHFEVGEIRFEISKNKITGEILFEVNAYSKPDRIPNIFYRTGFRIFGRSLQKYFAHSSIRRLQEIARSTHAQTPAKK